jgi:hypothetical protein
MAEEPRQMANYGQHELNAVELDGQSKEIVTVRTIISA